MHQLFLMPIIILPVFIFISVCNFLYRRSRTRNFLDYISRSFVLEPGEFFKLYYASISLLPGELPYLSDKKLATTLDYTKGQSKLSFLVLLPGLLNTATITRLVLKAKAWKGQTFCENIGEKVAATWGARIVQLSCSKFSLQDMQNVNDVIGRNIFIANHKSYVDFALLPLAISLLNERRTIHFKPRYMAAKDHFKDNFFLYSVLGIGKALEAYGTVFVDRKSSKEPAAKSVDTAVSAIIDDHVDIVMFPQGTRAKGNVDINGGRLDAGYYTTHNKKKAHRTLSHLKKGIIYIALKSVQDLQGNEYLNIIPLGISGTGIVAPRSKFLIQKKVDLKIRVGYPLRLINSEVDGLIRGCNASGEFLAGRMEMVEEVFFKVDEMLRGVLNLHGELKRRLMIDLRGILNGDELHRFLDAIDAWKADEYLIFSVIDCIYSLPQYHWSSRLRQLYHLLVETETHREKIIDFKNEL